MTTFDDILTLIQDLIMSILVRLGPFFVAFMPAMFTGYAIYHTFASEAGYEMALFFALVVGFGMEAVGIVATHTAIDLYNAKQSGLIEPVKFKLMAWLVPVYVIGVAAVVAFSKDAFTPLVKGLGIVSPFLTGIVYIAVALARDLKKAEQRERDKLNRERTGEDQAAAWEREKERLELELKHREKLARIEAKAPRKNPQFSPQIGQISPPVQVPKNEWRAQAGEILAQNPHISGAELGRMIGASERTGQNILNELREGLHTNGVNGNGKF